MTDQETVGQTKRMKALEPLGDEDEEEEEEQVEVAEGKLSPSIIVKPTHIS